MKPINRKLSAENFSTARKRLLQMHFDSGVGHIGGNLSALDAMLIVFHEYLSGEDKFVLSKGHSAGALWRRWLRICRGMGERDADWQ